MEDKSQIIALAKACISLRNKGRPEVEWIQRIYDRFRKEYRLPGKAETDRFIFEKMYSRIPEKASDVLKIRYWRTGRHIPGNRTQCLSFGRALELSGEEMNYFIQRYYDRSDQVFESVPDKDDLVYWERRAFMEVLVDEYLMKIHPSRRLQMKISRKAMEHHIRHLYYTDSMAYVKDSRLNRQMDTERHITSINYGTELSRNLKLIGEIPRKTMIRHLIVLGMPFISKEIISRWLENLGYLALCEDHTLVSGEYLDWLLIRFLEFYEERCRGKEPEQCIQWFQEGCRVLDTYFEKNGESNLRFMYYKALRE